LRESATRQFIYLLNRTTAKGGKLPSGVYIKGHDGIQKKVKYWQQSQINSVQVKTGMYLGYN
jgi:hypothetical protein